MPLQQCLEVQRVRSVYHLINHYNRYRYITCVKAVSSGAGRHRGKAISARARSNGGLRVGRGIPPYGPPPPRPPNLRPLPPLEPPRTILLEWK